MGSASGARSGLFAVLAVVALTLPAAAQDVCTRLESQLAYLDADEGRSTARVFRYDRETAEQHRLLDQLLRRSAQAGCDAGGGFQAYRPAACEVIERDIWTVRARIRELAISGEGLMPRRAGASEGLRHEILGALAAHGCGVRYARQDTRRFASTGTFFRDYSREAYQSTYAAPQSYGFGEMHGTFRTMCVRTCDGYAWPVSFSTVSSQFGDDERTCQASCGGADVRLFVYRNPGGGLQDAVSLSGAPYTALPNAFRYRREVVQGCGCRAADGVAVRTPDATTDQPPVATESPALPETAAPGAQGAAATITREPRPDVRVVGPGFTYYRSIEE